MKQKTVNRWCRRYRRLYGILPLLWPVANMTPCSLVALVGGGLFGGGGGGGSNYAFFGSGGHW